MSDEAVPGSGRPGRRGTAAPTPPDAEPRIERQTDAPGAHRGPEARATARDGRSSPDGIAPRAASVRIAYEAYRNGIGGRPAPCWRAASRIGCSSGCSPRALRGRGGQPLRRGHVEDTRRPPTRRAWARRSPSRSPASSSQGAGRSTCSCSAGPDGLGGPVRREGARLTSAVAWGIRPAAPRSWMSALVFSGVTFSVLLIPNVLLPFLHGGPFVVDIFAEALVFVGLTALLVCGSRPDAARRGSRGPRSSRGGRVHGGRVRAQARHRPLFRRAARPGGRPLRALGIAAVFMAWLYLIGRLLVAMFAVSATRRAGGSRKTDPRRLRAGPRGRCPALLAGDDSPWAATALEDDEEEYGAAATERMGDDFDVRRDHADDRRFLPDNRGTRRDLRERVLRGDAQLLPSSTRPSGAGSTCSGACSC